MSAPKRAAVLLNTHKVLAKHYKPITPVERPVLEEILYACCLEDTRPDVADVCFARLQESFFDWNEVRVTAVRELAEALRGSNDPKRAGTLIKHTLHSVFEAVYSFDLESLKKQNLGAAVKQLQEYRGTTPFSIGYAVQTALGGHSIPVSPAGMKVMNILGVVTDKSMQQGVVPGLERAIPKNKGIEFASLFQQFTADYAASPFGTQPRAILVEIDPAAKERFPKRGGGRKTVKAAVVKKKKVPQKKSVSVPKSAKGTPKKKIVKKKKAMPSSAKSKKKVTRPKTGKSISKRAAPAGKKSASKQLARRKPR